MPFKFDKKYLMIGMTAFGVIAAGILLFEIISNLPHIFSAIALILGILAPIFYGIAIAYVLTPVEKTVERFAFWIFKKQNKELTAGWKKVIRFIGTILSIVFLYAVIYSLMAMLVPQLFKSITSFANSMPYYLNKLETLLSQFMNNSNSGAESSALTIMEDTTNKITEWLNESLLPSLKNIMEMMTNSSSPLMNVVSVIKNFLIGSMIAIYFLIGKENYIANLKKFSYAFLGNVELTNNILRDCRYIERTFGGFLLGKIVDSAIIGVLCYIGTALLHIPYALLISVIVGITNIIPFFGPFIGAVPCFILILLVNPLKSLTFLVFVLVLQQIDGNLIGPKILGNSTGLSSFMVIVAILIGGGLFGIVGMIIGVPICACLYKLFNNALDNHLQRLHLPEKTEDYRGLERIDENTLKPEYNPNKERDRQTLFQYGVRGRKMSDPGSDDEVLREYVMHKSRGRRDKWSSTLTEENFMNIHDLHEESSAQEKKEK